MRTGLSEAGNKLYVIWKSLRQKHKKAITPMCLSWYESFDKFFEDVGEPPTDKCRLSRIDTELGYSKENCKWIEKIDRVGQVFDRLTVIELHEIKGTRKYYKCICSCGKYKIANESSLISGTTRSCGCLRKTHGVWFDTKSYRSWHRMRQRCNNPKCRDYRWYGAKGIKICERWDDYLKFVEDMGEPPSPKHTIDRIDSTKDYYKENCRWVTQLEQVRNCSSNIWITYKGRKQILSEWAREYNFSRTMLENRLKKFGDDLDKVFTTPKGARLE